MTLDWHPLTQELAAWRAEGRTLPLWWRDDDAIAPTAALDQLRALSEGVGLPVHLAIIPRDATEALAAYVADATALIPVQHGWSHQNAAPAEAKKAEFGDHRPLERMTEEIAQGRARMRTLFDAPPVFVPPWNRIAPAVVEALPGLGLTALSTFGPRRHALAAPGVEQVNTHLDPIDWRGSRSLVDPDRLITQIARDLADRRHGRTDAGEPYGILTHHLVHDPAIWRFTEDLVQRLMDGPVAVWTAEGFTHRTGDAE